MKIERKNEHCKESYNTVYQRSNNAKKHATPRFMHTQCALMRIHIHDMLLLFQQECGNHTFVGGCYDDTTTNACEDALHCACA